ncbi:MAG: hypothetical protein EOP34_07870 [Rickettsiales bacterium]|nr:MAG: hypothetical protein EOP34_07870 [Rickettsiales bacterium]
MSTKLHKNIISANGQTLIEHGRCEITTQKELEKYKLGSLVSYETIDGRYTRGGFIIKFNCDCFFLFINYNKPICWFK